MSLIHYTLEFRHLISKEIILTYPEKVRFDEILPKGSIIKINGKGYKIKAQPVVNYDTQEIFLLVIDFPS